MAAEAAAVEGHGKQRALTEAKKETVENLFSTVSFCFDLATASMKKAEGL